MAERAARQRAQAVADAKVEALEVVRRQSRQQQQVVGRRGSSRQVSSTLVVRQPGLQRRQRASEWPNNETRAGPYIPTLEVSVTEARSQAQAIDRSGKT